MNKKINIMSKPLVNKSADDWVASRKSILVKQIATKRLTIDVPTDLHSQIKVQCAKGGVKMSDVLRDIPHEKFGGTA